MILANEINKFTTLDHTELSRACARNGYMNMVFESSEFLGITNGGDFCYRVSFHEDDQTHIGKVFVSKHVSGEAVAEF